jgi:hypothetical protein
VSPVELLAWWYPVIAWAAMGAAVTAAGVTAVRGSAGGALSGAWRSLPVLAGLVAFVPIGGLPVGRWLLGVTGPFSVPLVAVLLDQAAAVVRGRPFFDAPAKWAAIGFALACGLVVYPAALGLGRVDPYVWGWASPGVSLGAAVLGGGLLLAGNRFGWALLAAGVLWQLGGLESTNGWDYLVDPIVTVVAASAAAGAALKAVFSRLFQRGCGLPAGPRE